MRIDDDNLRSDSTFWRRIIVLLVVIAGVPVILWSTTAFVRSYVARPKVPTFRALSSALVETQKAVVADAQVTPQPDAATQQGNSSEARPLATVAPMVQTVRVAAKGAPGTTDMPSLDATADTAKAAVNAPAVSNAADPVTVGSTTEQQPPTPAFKPGAAAFAAIAPAVAESTLSPDATAEALPAVAPLPDPVPLPRFRPHDLAASQLGPPLPRPRPRLQAQAAEQQPSATPDGPPNLFTPQ